MTESLAQYLLDASLQKRVSLLAALPSKKVVNKTVMKIDKKKILDNICYRDLVYGRINKKLGIHLTNIEIEGFIIKIIDGAHEDNFEIIGKNYYINNYTEKIKLTINRNTTRIITVDRIENNYRKSQEKII